MTDEDRKAAVELKAALLALIAETEAKNREQPPGRVPSEAERDNAIRFSRVQ